MGSISALCVLNIDNNFEQLDPFRHHSMEKVGVTLLSEVVSEH